MVQHSKSLLGLWSLVNSGGYYVVEDLSTSYVAETGGGAQGSPSTMIGLIEDLIDGLNARHCCNLAQEPCANPLSQPISFQCFVFSLRGALSSSSFKQQSRVVASKTKRSLVDCHVAKTPATTDFMAP